MKLMCFVDGGVGVGVGGDGGGLGTIRIDW
jgi:hypothetical protein